MMSATKEPDRTTVLLIRAWVCHRAARPADSAEALVNVEHLRRKMDAWQATDDAYRLLVGTRLADQALAVALGETP